MKPGFVFGGYASRARDMGLLRRFGVLAGVYRLPAAGRVGSFEQMAGWLWDVEIEAPFSAWLAQALAHGRRKGSGYGIIAGKACCEGIMR